jgi:hypothetical protein
MVAYRASSSEDPGSIPVHLHIFNYPIICKVNDIHRERVILPNCEYAKVIDISDTIRREYSAMAALR